MRISDWSSDVCSSDLSIHIHAFSPLEVTHGASTLGLSLHDFLTMLKEEGLATLPGTAAEILDDEVRAIICPDQVNTAEWLEVMRTAHAVGLRSTATLMFGHVDRYANRSEERRVGKEGVSTCRSRWSSSHSKNKHIQYTQKHN